MSSLKFARDAYSNERHMHRLKQSIVTCFESPLLTIPAHSHDPHATRQHLTALRAW